MKTYSIELNPNISELERLFSWLKCLPQNDIIALNSLFLVCEEVFCNIVEHGYRDLPEKDYQQSIHLDVAIQEGEILLRFTDEGETFNPDQLPQADTFSSVEDRKIGGLGWHLIRYFIDKIDYRREENKNVLFLMKQKKGDTMETITKVVDDVTVVYLKGKLDAVTSGNLEQTLMPILDSGSVKVVLDFTELSYISSAGLRVLLKAAKQIKALDGQFVLCSMKDFIKEVFDISGFSGILSIVENCESAVATING
jgi:anti-anti-sigma factor